MKNIFYCSNAHAEIFKNNTRSNFNSYIDIHHLEYLDDDDIEAAIKSVTYDDKTLIEIRINHTKPSIVIRHKIKKFNSWCFYFICISMATITKYETCELRTEIVSTMSFV